MTLPTVSEPVPIHRVADKYLLHDADTVSYLRHTHNITGVLIGGLPQAPQQNVFLGLPVELMPEEARLLVEKNVAYIVDDVAQHVDAFVSNGLAGEEKARFEQLLERQGTDAAKMQVLRAEERKDTALRKIAGSDAGAKKVGNGDMDNWNDMPEGMLAPRPRGSARTKSRQRGAERSASSSVAPTLRTSGGPPNSSGPPSASPSGPPSGPPSRTRTPVTTAL